QLVGAMEEAEIDLWITPAAPGAAPAGLDSTGDPVMNLPWSQAGLPSLSLPAGRNAQRLPLGLQAIGRWWADESLLLWGAQLAETVG
ncbi:MAG: amidase family protein, partial [Acidobacteriota bacterium]